ncbi:protein CREG2 [Thrips palmi]|uniref:Protein CREG2 n=1 Tax=Thrips palmi TaxID=161013 RepID=A0A6P8Y5A4_THRPL|nr:protein CREG2 [Thrips palmi]XP_034234758.1 protein CREG2 [Thrips palmi]XP_034234760.1 protein CREG2 [Thrips palmi]
MRFAVVGLVLLALVIGDNLADARRKGEENWKQRYQNWKDSEEQSRHQHALIGTDEAAAARLHREEEPRQPGALIGTDEAAAARLHREEQNSVYDTPTEEELWRQKIEEKKRRLSAKKSDTGAEIKPASEITAWHEEKWRRKQERRLQAVPYELQRQKRRQPRDYRSDAEQVRSNPPPHTKVAEMARYIVHHSDWAAVAYTSKQPGTYGLPMADIFSISDGLRDNSTGIPYMYVSPLDLGVQDLIKDSRCSLAMTLAQGDYCQKEGLDPEDPRCAHVFLTGKIKSLKNGSEEYVRAEKFFFDRHPHLRNMPKDHKFRFAKLKISQILVQDYFGGPAQPSLAEYFAAKPEDVKPVPKKPAEDPARETEAELLPGASDDLFKWARPIE